ncbi:MAG: DUF4013 domain-containing protein [Chloroflexi bacterium]|nr:MAG: DUF4013 domain-containing protein [Chloroflexota bacterium]
MDLTRALKFPFDDENWLMKFVVGTLMSLVGVILPFIPLGYQVHVARSVMRGHDRPLPGSEDIGQVVADGLMAFIGGLVYAIPGLLVGCFLMFSDAILSGSDIGGLLFLCLLCVFVPIMFLYGVAAMAMTWMGIIRYTESGNFSEFLRFGELFRDVRDNTSTLLTLLLYMFLVGLIVSLGMSVAWITCVGIPALIFYSQVVSGHLLGQAGLEITRS